MTRGDCENGARPCPYLGCKYHLGVEITRHGVKFAGRYGESKPGAIKVVKDSEITSEMIAGALDRQTCALDAIEQSPDGMTLEQVAEAMGVTRERIRQIEASAMRKLQFAEVEGHSRKLEELRLFTVHDMEGRNVGY